MKPILLGLLFPFAFPFTPSSNLVLDYQPASNFRNNLAVDSVDDDFYTLASRLVQQQIYLTARIEQALLSPDPHRMRSVRGQLTVQSISVDTFLKRQFSNPQTLCVAGGDFSRSSPLPVQFTESKAKIYCALSASNQELLNLRPMIDQLLSRRGELALVRELPLVSGERQSDPVLSIKPVQIPLLNQPATPFASREPDLSSPPAPVVGRTAKTAIANYRPPVQPAITAPEEAINTIKTAEQYLKLAQAEFPIGTKFINPQQDAAALDRFAYNVDFQEPQIYAKFLELPQTGLFRVLPELAYGRMLNTLQNRLQPSVSERYPFPVIGQSKEGFKSILPLQMVDDNFQLVQSGLNYGFIVDVGDIPLEELEQQLLTVATPKREFLLNYQPPKQLESLQVDRRRFITGKNQDWQETEIYLAQAPARVNHTYLVRSLQFQLPEALINRVPILPSQSRERFQFSRIPSSDTIIAFRPVRRRSDGSYTILWRVINQLAAPQIDDIEKYIP